MLSSRCAAAGTCTPWSSQTRKRLRSSSSPCPQVSTANRNWAVSQSVFASQADWKVLVCSIMKEFNYVRLILNIYISLHLSWVWLKVPCGVLNHEWLWACYFEWIWYHHVFLVYAQGCMSQAQGRCDTCLTAVVAVHRNRKQYANNKISQTDVNKAVFRAFIKMHCRCLAIEKMDPACLLGLGNISGASCVETNV